MMMGCISVSIIFAAGLAVGWWGIQGNSLAGDHDSWFLYTVSCRSRVYFLGRGSVLAGQAFNKAYKKQTTSESINSTFKN